MKLSQRHEMNEEVYLRPGPLVKQYQKASDRNYDIAYLKNKRQGSTTPVGAKKRNDR